jgi:hypothetical protein
MLHKRAVRALLFVFLAVASALAAEKTTALDRYVQAPDPSF